MQTIQKHVPHMQRRCQHQRFAVFTDDSRECDAHTEQFFPIDMVPVQKLLQCVCKTVTEFTEIHMGVPDFAAVAKLLQPQIRQRHPHPRVRNGNADGNSRIRYDIKAHGAAAAGGALFSGECDQSGLHQFRQILIDRGQTQAELLRKRLLGTEPLMLI